MSKEQVVETVDDFISDIKTKYPQTSKYIDSRYPTFTKKLETAILEAIFMTTSQSAEMESQVNIYIYYIFYKQVRYCDSAFAIKIINSLMLYLTIL